MKFTPTRPVHLGCVCLVFPSLFGEDHVAFEHLAGGAQVLLAVNPYKDVEG